QRILERLSLHDVAPVTGGVADREQDRAILGARALERLVAPRVPVDGIARMLLQVWRRLVGEAVHRRARRKPSTASVSPAARPNARRSAAQTGSSKKRPPK